MYLLVIFIPLLSALISGLFGRKIGEKGAGLITTISIMITCVLSYTILYEVGLNGSPTYIKLWNWMESGLFTVNFGFMFDSVTCIMLILVTTVSSLVHIYSTEYMAGDPHKPRFMSYLTWFTFFMLILVTADNLLQVFIGWEGVGLCSFLLINFWFTRIQANKSAIKAMVINRIGDVGIALAMFVLYQLFGTVEFAPIFSLAPLATEKTFTLIGGYEVHGLTLAAILLFVGAVGKSAQLGLHTWLPDAMEGPTPVSALIHAATMVTAGVFLLIRCSPLIEYAPQALTVITIVGAITAFFAATIGLVQNDIKKVIAYSTCSQLGYMVFACGISNYATSLFHLMNHGFFKALLFLSAGSVIHAMMDEQDMRKLGGLIHKIPYTYSLMLIGSLSLMGFPFLTGYYSKDAILELAYAKYTFDGTFAHWLGTISAFFTAFYSFRLIYLTFVTEPTSSQNSYNHAHESPWPMTVPLAILAVGSIFVGYLFKDMMIGVGTTFFGNAIFVLPHNVNIFEAEFLDPFIKWVPVIFSMLGASLSFIVYHNFRTEIIGIKAGGNLGRSLYTFFNNKWHFDYLQNSYIAKPFFSFGLNVTYKILDRGLIEFVGPYGLAQLFSQRFATFASYLQSGLVYSYAFIIIIFATLFLIIITTPISFIFARLELLAILPILVLLASDRMFNNN